MRKIIIIFSCILNFFNFQYSIEKIVIDQNKSPNFLGKMSKNNTFIRRCVDIDIDDYGFYYFLDHHFCWILKVDQKSGKLEKVISSKGQGPGELQDPTSFKVKKKLIYVIDRGFQGIKVFDLDGKIINEFKTKVRPVDIDVDDRGEIYLAETNIENNKLISVYDCNGKIIRSLINIDKKKKKKAEAYVAETYIRLSLDSERNIIILYYLKREVAKYNNKGELIWKREIKNEILNKYPNKDKINVSKESRTISFSIFNLDLNKNDDILIAHKGGGVIYNKYGDILRLITFKKPHFLFVFTWFNNKIVDVTKDGHKVLIHYLGGI